MDTKISDPRRVRVIKRLESIPTVNSKSKEAHTSASLDPRRTRVLQRLSRVQTVTPETQTILSNPEKYFYNPVFKEKEEKRSRSPVSQLNSPDLSKMPRFATTSPDFAIEKEIEETSRKIGENKGYITIGTPVFEKERLNREITELTKKKEALENPTYSTNAEELDRVIANTNKKITSVFSVWTTPDKIADARLSVERVYSDIANYINTYGKELRSAGNIKNASELLITYKGMLESLDDLESSYGDYKTEKEYNQAVRKNEGLYTLDLTGAKSEIEDLEKRVAAYQPLYNKLYQNKGLTAAEQAKALSIIGEYGSYPELEKALGEKTAYYNRASYKQEGASLGDVGKEDSNSYDPEYLDYVAKGNAIPYGTIGSKTKVQIAGSGSQNVIHTEDSLDTTRAAALALAEHNGTDIEKELTGLDSSSRKKIDFYRELTDEEFDTLAYHLARDRENGTNNAERYLFTIEEKIHSRRAEKIAKELEGKTFQSILYAGKAGVSQFGTNIKNLIEQKEGYIPLNTTQQASGMVRENLKDVSAPIWFNVKTGEWEDTISGASLGQLTYDAVNTTANMLPSILTAKVANLILPGAGAAVGSTLIGMSSAGGAYQEMINLGYNKGQANAYALMTGVSEALLERAIGGFSDLGGISKKLESLVKGIDNATARLALQLGGSMAGEFLEEATQEALSPLLQNWALTYSKNDWDDVKWGEVLYSGILGALSSLGHEAIPQTVSTIAEAKKNKTTSPDLPNGVELTTPNVPSAELSAEQKNTAENGDAPKLTVVNSGISAINEKNKENNSLSYILATNTDKIKDMEAVTTLTGAEFNNREVSLPEQIRSFFKSIGNKVFRKNFGDVEFGEYGVGGVMNHRPLNRAKLVSLAAAPNVISQGKQISYTPNWKGRGYESFVFAAPIKINGSTVYVAAVVDKRPNNKFYLSEMIDSNGNYVRIETSPADTSKSGVTNGGTNVAEDGITAEPTGLSEEDNLSAQATEPMSSSTLIVSQPEAEVNTFTPRANPTPNSEVTIMAPRAFEKGPVLPTAEEIARERRAGKAETELEASAIRLGVSEDITKEALEISQGLQRNIKFVYSDDTGDEGWYDSDTDTICINVNAKTFGTGFVGVIVHEITHSIENAPGYAKLYQGVMAQKERNQASLKAEQEKWIERYRLRGKTLTIEGANREIVADYARQKLFTDKKSIEDVAQKNHNFAIWMYERLEKLRTLFGRTVKEQKFIEYARHLWVEAIEKADRQTRLDSSFEESDYFDYDLDALVEDAEQHSYIDNDDETVQKPKHKQVRDLGIDWDEDNFSSLKTQLLNHIDEVNSMEPVVKVTYSKKDKRPYYKVLENVLKNTFGNKIDIQGVGNILFDEGAISSIKNYIETDAERAAAIAAPYVIKKGKIISGHLNHKEQGTVSITFAAPAILNNQKGNVVVSVMYGKGRVHSLRVLSPDGKAFELIKTKDTESTTEKISSTMGRSNSATVDPYINSMSNNMITPTNEKVNSKNSPHSYTDVYEETAEESASPVISNGKIIPSGTSLIDNMPLEEYNMRGWAYGLFSTEDLSLLNERWKSALSKNYKDKTSDGLSVIKLNNKVIFASGTYNKPIIENVIVYNASNENELIVAEGIVTEGDKYGNFDRTRREKLATLEEYLQEEGLFIFRNRNDYQSHNKGIGEDSSRRAVQPSGFKNFGYAGSYEFRDGVFLQDERQVSRGTPKPYGTGFDGKLNKNSPHSYTDDYEGTAEESASSVIDSSPKVVKNFISGVEYGTQRRIRYLLPVSYSMLDRVMSKPLRAISEELMRTGDVSQVTVERAFEEIYEKSLETSRDYTERYTDVNSEVSGMTIKLSPREYEIFSEKISKLRRFLPDNTVRFSKSEGISLDDAWSKLNSLAPELFPRATEKIESRVSKILYHVIDYSFASSYVKNPNEQTKRWKLDDFKAVISDMVVKERSQALRYMNSSENQKLPAQKFDLKGDWLDDSEPIPIPQTPEEASALYKNRRDAVKRRGDVYRKYIFTKSDQIQILRILRGDIRIEDLNPNRDNVDGITAVIPLEKECERYSKAIEKFREAHRAKLDKESDYNLRFVGSRDKKLGINYSTQTAQRNFRYLVPDANGANKEFADELVDTYVLPISHSEAEKNRYTAELFERVKTLGLSRRVAKGNTHSEAALVQMYGEARDNLSYLANRKIEGEKREGKTAQEWEEYIENLFLDNPNVDRAKIENAVKTFRDIYNELFKKLNETLVRNGYEPIEYRHGYFPHFKADEDNILNYFASKLGFDAGLDLPTTINGLTQNFRPGKSWFGNAESRHGTDTAYDALEGFEKYLNGAANVIYQTDNIQRLRSLARRIRYNASDAGIKEKIDEIEKDNTKTEDQKDEEIKTLTSNQKYGLSNFVVWLDEYTNLLAGKKSKYDRLVEGEFGRRGIYGALKKIYQTNGANMVIGNLTSAMTNFVPIVDSCAMTGTVNTIRASFDTLRNLKVQDGLMSLSDFYTNRTSSNKLVMNWLEKSADKAGLAMNIVDSFATEVIIRSRYYQNIKDGMSEELALREADAFAESIMAGRSKGEMPNIFHAQSLKILTQFQLEVANQFSVLFSDMPAEIRKRGVAYGVGLALRLVIGTALLNGLLERLFGRRVKLDPIDILNEFIGDVSGKKLADPIEELFDLIWRGDPFEIIKDVEKENAWKALASTGEDIVKEIPFIGSIFGGGRLPIANALPGVFSEFGDLVGAMSNENTTPAQKAKKAAEFALPKVATTLLPFGYNQISKSAKGIEAVRAGGKFKTNNSGEVILQYPYYTDEGIRSVGNALRAIIFGTSSLPEGREWVERDFVSFTPKETEGYLEAVATGEGQRKIFETIMSLKTLEPENPEDTVKRVDKFRALSEADISREAKYAIYKTVLATEDELERIQKMFDSGASETAVMNYALSFVTAERKFDEKENTYESLPKLEQWRFAIDSTKNTKERLALLKELTSETQYANFELCAEYNVPLDAFVTLKESLPKYDKNENDSYSSDEIKTAINSLFTTVNIPLTTASGKTTQLTREGKAVLWQLASGSTSPSSNPYGNYQIAKRIVEYKKRIENRFEE